MLRVRSIIIDRKPIAVCFALALLAWSSSEAWAQQQATSSKQFPFQSGEELIYKAEMSKGLLRSVDVAEFRFTVAEEQLTRKAASGDDPIPVFRFSGDVSSNGFFVRLFRVQFHQKVDSTVDRGAFTVLQTTKAEEQNKRARASEAIFDHETRKVTWTERDPNNPGQTPRVASAEFVEPIQDVLSAIYFLRTRRLEVGKSIEIELSDSGRVFRLPVAVIERKRMKTPLGYLEALRVEPALFGDRGMVRGEGKFSIWLTDDSRHIPIRAQVKVPAGTFDIKLKRVSYQSAR